MISIAAGMILCGCESWLLQVGCLFFSEFSLFFCLDFAFLLDELSLFLLSHVVTLLSLFMRSLFPCFFLDVFFCIFFAASHVVLFADVEGGAVVEDSLGRSPRVPRGVPVLLPCLCTSCFALSPLVTLLSLFMRSLLPCFSSHDLFFA